MSTEYSRGEIRQPLLALPPPGWLAEPTPAAEPAARRRSLRHWFGRRRRPLASPGLDHNGLRQCLRISGGAALGFVISQLLDSSYGVFFVVFPMFLLGVIPAVNAHVARQFIGTTAINCVELTLVVGFLSHWPPVMTAAVFALFAGRFALMARGPMFLFGAHGVVSLSIMLHYSSYPDTDLMNLMGQNLLASFVAVAVALLMLQLFPDVEPRKPRARPQKSAARIRHETLLGATVATLSFAVFQVVELRDSMSAQISTVVILFALHYPDTIHTAHKRAFGTLLGSALAVAMQLVLYSHVDNLLLVMIPLWCGLMLFARAHILEGGASGIGFSGLTTMGILFGQYVAPDQDLLYSAFYRISSVMVALVCGLAVTALVHRLLNRFELTRTDAPS